MLNLTLIVVGIVIAYILILVLVSKIKKRYRVSKRLKENGYKLDFM